VARQPQAVFAECYYVKNGKPTSTMSRIRIALRILLDLYGKETSSDFGPLKFKVVRQRMIEQEVCIAVVHRTSTQRQP